MIDGSIKTQFNQIHQSASVTFDSRQQKYVVYPLTVKQNIMGIIQLQKKPVQKCLIFVGKFLLKI